MTKKHFIELAEVIRDNFVGNFVTHEDEVAALRALADYCQRQNPNFDRDRWFAYIAGECGPSGGKIKTTQGASR